MSFNFEGLLEHCIKTMALSGVLILCSLNATGQDPVIEEDSSVQQILDRYIADQHEQKEVQGWRILVLSTRDRRDMEQKKRAFERQFDSIELQWEYRDPNYRLYAGAFQNRLEMRPMLTRIKKKFPQAVEVKDRIPIGEFLDQYETK